MNDVKVFLVVVLTAVAGATGRIAMQEVTDPAANGLPNPNPVVIKNWGEIPGRTWGNTAGVDVGPDGQIWAYDRCGGNSCEGSMLDPILKFDRRSGKLLKSFGGGLLVFPHGLHVDREGNVWVTDGARSKDGSKGHQVFKFSPDGKVLMTLGQPGVAGGGSDGFTEPTDVVTAPNGDIFVSEGHGMKSTSRIVKFTRDGKFIKEWGKLGTGPGEFRVPHALALDSRGRLFVADRVNHRIQVFDQDGKLLGTFFQFGRVSGIFIDRKDMLYAIDSESTPERHPNWKTGVRIGSAKQDKVLSFIPPHQAETIAGAAGEGVAVDPDGNVYGAEGPNSRKAAEGGLTKYLRK